jgi:hypothetical protein
MRKRHTARPRLESMEDRLALSALGAAAPTAEVHTTRLARVEAHQAQEAAARAAKHDATVTHHHAVKHTTPPPKSSTKTSSTNIFSQFLKSTFGL